MRFMIIVKATADSEAGVMPEEAMLQAMAAYHEELARAGVLLDGNGLQATAKGFRVQYDGDRRTVIDGPFAETKELIAGFTIIQVASKEEAVEWARRFPNPYPGNAPGYIEVRRMFELEDFGESDTLDRFRELDMSGSH
ncbi:MAG: YciI family protein [Geminicoccaceae bacterium]